MMVVAYDDNDNNYNVNHNADDNYDDFHDDLKYLCIDGNLFSRMIFIWLY